jgi:peptidoglycan/xylan/chitin deacetylase (PgdA/CDA1 family)
MNLVRFSVLFAGLLGVVYGCTDKPNLGDDESGGSAGRPPSGGSTARGGVPGFGGSASGGVAQGGRVDASSGGTAGSAAGGSAGRDAQGGTTGNAQAGEAGAGGNPEGGSAEGGGAGEGGRAAEGGSAGSADAGAGGVADVGGAGGAGGAGGDDAIVIGASDYPFMGSGGAVAKPSGTAGNLRVLDWAGFKAAVSYTFDDTNQTQIDHYDQLNAEGVRYTFYLQTNKGELNSPVWVRAVADGHEIGNHTVHHMQEQDLVNLPNPGDEIDLATQTLETKFGVKVWTMAAPYGQQTYADLAATRFFINRGVSNGLMYPNDTKDPLNLYCFIPNALAPSTDLNTQVDLARTGSGAHGGWRVFLVHGFTGGSDGAYNAINIDDFLTNVDYTKTVGDVWIDTVYRVGAYWLGQRAFNHGTKTSSGSETTWTWDLPAHFPTGQYLRVVVDGGTLRQAGTTLAWNSHGFYEVALDAKSLTLSP